MSAAGRQVEKGQEDKEGRQYRQARLGPDIGPLGLREQKVDSHKVYCEIPDALAVGVLGVGPVVGRNSVQQGSIV